jgi:DNA polymerase-3 subunit gamma/tau
MEQLNLLVNAGHSPSSLARQMVRYLRNALMAKLGGERTELLQISGDERARAARTALLFTEEELTRNLQIVLRTFDDLNYRQEQRFHLELGLLKLIHAQRLLPLEELLSGVASGVGARDSAVNSQPPPAPARPASAPATQAAPPLSPFGPSAGSSGGSWSSGPKMDAGITADSVIKPFASADPVATLERPSPSPVAPSAGYAATRTEGALARALHSTPSSAPSIDGVRHAIGVALVEGGHISAAQLLGAGEWTLEGSSLRIEVAAMGKKMLALTVNAAAEKIIRQELQRLGAPSRFLIVPGASSEGAASPSSPPSAPVAAGSVREAALAHPLVQQAREIFKAEVRSVVDLRQK